MWALVTGASSGIGRDIAKKLSIEGYNIILVARDEEKLKEVQSEIKTETEVVSLDLSNADKCVELYEYAKHKNIELLVNDAGFGDFGEFTRNKFRQRIKDDKYKCGCFAYFNKTFFKRYGKKQ